MPLYILKTFSQTKILFLKTLYYQIVMRGWGNSALERPGRILRLPGLDLRQHKFEVTPVFTPSTLAPAHEERPKGLPLDRRWLKAGKKEIEGWTQKKSFSRKQVFIIACSNHELATAKQSALLLTSLSIRKSIVKLLAVCVYENEGN